MSREYISDRLDKLIAEGELVLKTYNQFGNIDHHDLWYTEVKNFLSVNGPQFVERLRLVAPKYSEQLLLEPRGRAAYNLIQEQLEIVKLARASLTATPASPVLHTAQVHVVILVHGIRDFALWQSTLRTALEEEGFKVEATNYGRFNLLQFLVPFAYLRQKAIAAVWNQIRILKQNNEGALLSVVAHSFGTFVVAQLMERNFDIKFHRVIFCGSVVRYNFPFENFQERFHTPIINEVGTRDIWPAIAESITSGYGSAGTCGFRRPLVRDRWHNDACHGRFLNRDFCKKFWSPFLRDGTFVPGADEPQRPSVWLQALSIIKIKYILIVAVLLSFFHFVPKSHLQILF